MNSKNTAAHYLPLLLSILCIGTSGPLARLIHISPVALIFFRSAIALVALSLILKFSGKQFLIQNKKQRNFILLSGLFLAAHWVAYFFALQLSSVALGMLSMFTYPVITVVLEPLYLKTKLRLIQIPLALIAFAGIYILLPDFNIKNSNTLGVLIGVGSAFFYAWRNLLLKKHSVGVNGITVITNQLIVVVLVTAPLLFFIPISFTEIKLHWYYLLFLGLFTTALGHSSFVKSLQYFSTATVSIISNFTPVVGIILGIIFLNEKPSGNILLGGSLILITALLEVWMGVRKKS